MELSEENRILNTEATIILHNKEDENTLTSLHNLKDSVTSVVSHALILVDTELEFFTMEHSSVFFIIYNFSMICIFTA